MSFNVYQPFLDYGLVPNPAVIFPTVIDNYEWGLFKDIAKDYYLCLKEFRAKEHKQSVWDSDQFQQELFDPSLFYTRAEVDKNLKGAGRKPQDFMSLLKSFTCARYMDVEVNSRTICSLLNSNPAFLEKMGYKDNRLPSYRVIDRFDQVLTEHNLWEKITYIAIDANIQDKVINSEQECFLIVDTTHVPAKARKNKVVKPCRECIFSKTCQWRIPTDDNAGVLTKSKTERYYAHKVGLSTPSKSALPIGWFVDRGERFDGRFLEPLLDQLIEHYPCFENISHVIGNGTFGSKENEEITKSRLKAKLVTPINPRRCKEIPSPARGIKKITKYGQPVCLADFPMLLYTRSRKTKEYIWVCAKLHPESPDYEEDFVCEFQERCSKGRYGRAFRTKAEAFPQIDWELPQFSKEGKGLLALRTTIERDISWLKQGLKMESLWKRGKKNVIAHVAKCLLSMHIVANVAHKIGSPGSMHRIKTFSV